MSFAVQVMLIANLGADFGFVQLRSQEISMSKSTSAEIASFSDHPDAMKLQKIAYSLQMPIKDDAPAREARMNLWIELFMAYDKVIEKLAPPGRVAVSVPPDDNEDSDAYSTRSRANADKIGALNRDTALRNSRDLIVAYFEIFAAQSYSSADSKKLDILIDKSNSKSERKNTLKRSAAKAITAYESRTQHN